MTRRIVLALLLFSLCSCAGQGVPLPELNRPYPDMQLFDESGQSVSLESFRGKVILLHAVSMGCSICQGLSGADRFGPYGILMPAAGVSSLEYYLNRYSKGAAADPLFQVVQIVFFNSHGEPPTPEELADWSRHFRLRERGIVVLGAPMGLAETVGKSLVPGFQLLDTRFVLRADSTGGMPRHDFTRQLLPGLSALLRVSKR